MLDLFEVIYVCVCGAVILFMKKIYPKINAKFGLSDAIGKLVPKRLSKKVIDASDYISKPIYDDIYKIEDCYNEKYNMLLALYLNWLLLKKSCLLKNEVIRVEECVFDYDDLSVTAKVKKFGVNSFGKEIKIRCDYSLRYPLENIDEYNNLEINIKERELFSFMEYIHNNFDIKYPDVGFEEGVMRASVAKQIVEKDSSIRYFSDYNIDKARFEEEAWMFDFCVKGFRDQNICEENTCYISIDPRESILYKYVNQSRSVNRDNREILMKFLSLDDEDSEYYEIIRNKMNRHLKIDIYGKYYKSVMESLKLKKDNPEALFTYGMYKRDIEYLKEAANLNHSLAKFYLGICYYNYELVKERDYDIAFGYFKLAALDGEAHAIYMLGECYLEGRGVRKNLQLAGDCFKKSGELLDRMLPYWRDEIEFDPRKRVDELYVNGRWDKNKYDPSLSKVLVDTGELKNNIDTNNKNKVIEYRKKYEALLERGLLDEAALNLRKILEVIIDDYTVMYSPINSIDSVFDKINILQKKDIFSDHEMRVFHKLRMLANRGAHNGKKLSADELEEAKPWIDEIVDRYTGL